MESAISSSFIAPVVLLLAVLFIRQVPAFPSGAPLSACSHLMPVHIDGVLEESASPYVLILNDTKYGNGPIKLSVTTVGSEAGNFMAFMLQARSEYEEPAGYFSDVPQASKTISCYGDDDTLTHTAAFIRPAMEVIWHPPNKNIGKIRITGSVAVSKIKYWIVNSEGLTGTGKLDLSGAKIKPGGGSGGGNGAAIMAVSIGSLAAILLIMIGNMLSL